jgi:glutamyl-Q tRNA(Asp) synthetase
LQDIAVPYCPFTRAAVSLEDKMMFVTRFAPSPTGFLHLGHAFSALTAFDWAKRRSARFLLRIEDLDQTRCRPEFETAIYEDLAWLGLRWEIPVRRQHDHLAAYEANLASLIDNGLVYRCFKTRKDLMAETAGAPHGPQAVFRGAPLPAHDENAKLLAGEPFAWRLSVSASSKFLAKRATPVANLGFVSDHQHHTIDLDRISDVVLARKEFPASYHLACVVDDGLQGVTDIIRGEDLAEAVHTHVLLQAFLGLPTPTYHHHRLILGDDGKRLAKRDHAKTLRSLRDEGVTPTQIRAILGLEPVS